MAGALAISFRCSCDVSAESRDLFPPQVARLLAAAPGAEAEEAWSAFLSAYSGLLLRVSSAFAPGYDGALDRYTYMLDELRRSDCRRLRAFAADGRGRFSTWLTVVARRLCLDHYRQVHGRSRPAGRGTVHASPWRMARRELSDLSGTCHEMSDLPDPALRDPAEEMDERDRRTALRHAVAKLAPGDQLLIRLRFEQGLTAREIAPLLGLPTQFHVYRRLETICGIVRDQLSGGAPSANLRPAGSRRKCAR